MTGVTPGAYEAVLYVYDKSFWVEPEQWQIPFLKRRVADYENRIAEVFVEALGESANRPEILARAPSVMDSLISAVDANRWRPWRTDRLVRSTIADAAATQD